MFRCAKKLKAIAIDYDSFTDNSFEEWKELSDVIKCIFITSSLENYKILSDKFDNEKILFLREFEKKLSPSLNTHSKVLNLLDLVTSEIGYISCDYSFIKQASHFLSATIWVSEMVEYDNTKNLPDLVITNINLLIKRLSTDILGYLGEIVLFPDENRRGSIINILFHVDEYEIKLYIMGRYFGYNHYLSQLHPLSAAISLNKKAGKSYENIFNEEFARIYAAGIKVICEKQVVDGVCSVPVKPSKVNRFEEILDFISKECHLQNLNDDFSCIRTYDDQKGLNAVEREKNITGVFRYTGDILGKTVILIDDIVTTGATLRECVRVLYKAGAKEVIAVVMAINQMSSLYWNKDNPQVSCPTCRNKMNLLVNKNGKFFYSCSNCYKMGIPNQNMNFLKGWEYFLDEEREKFDNVNSKNINDEWLEDSFE